MTDPKYLYGLMHFEDGVRPVLMWRANKYFHAIYIDGIFLVKRYVLFHEEKFFKEHANSNTDLKEVKRIARFMKSKSKCCGMKREMTKAIKNIIKEVLAYESPTQDTSSRSK